jgi:hypothetical protein
MTTRDPKFKHTMRLWGVVTFVSFALAGLALIGQSREAHNRRAANAATWHAVICAIERATAANPLSTVQQSKAQIAFFNDLLVQDVHTVPCKVTVPHA